MAVINGAKSVEDVIRTVKAGFFAVIRVCPVFCTCHCKRSIIFTKINWIVSPLSMVIAQQFIPVQVGQLNVQK